MPLLGALGLCNLFVLPIIVAVKYPRLHLLSFSLAPDLEP